MKKKIIIVDDEKTEKKLEKIINKVKIKTETSSNKKYNMIFD
jgi:hypothetical protein